MTTMLIQRRVRVLCVVCSEYLFSMSTITVRARCRVKAALRHTCVVLRMRTLHATTFARYTLAELRAQSPEVPRGVMVRVRARDRKWIFFVPFFFFFFFLK